MKILALLRSRGHSCDTDDQSAGDGKPGMSPRGVYSLLTWRRIAATFALLLTFGLLSAADLREGNFNIRIEPTANLQTGAQIPFSIQVTDALHKPLPSAKVTLQIETEEHKLVKVYPAPGLDPGMYVAKPVFPEAGKWNVYVEVRRADQMSSRTIQFNIPQ